MADELSEYCTIKKLIKINILINHKLFQNLIVSQFKIWNQNEANKTLMTHKF